MNKLNVHIDPRADMDTRAIGEDLSAGLFGRLEIPMDHDEKGTLLCIGLDPYFVKREAFNNYKRKVILMPVFGTLIKNSATKLINRFDQVVVNSFVGMRTLVRNGVYKPIKVIPGHYRPSMLDIQQMPKLESVLSQDTSGKILMYHESDCNGSENLRLLYKSFVLAFSDNEFSDRVVLLVKDKPYNEETFKDHENIKDNIIKLQANFRKPAKILKFSARLNDAETNWLRRRADVFLSAAGIENFNIRLLHGLLLDKPIVALRNKNSGYMDYLNEYNSYLVNTKLEPANSENQWLYSKGSKWAHVESDILAAVLKHVLVDVTSKKARRLSKNQREADRMFERFKFDRILADYATILKNN